MRVVIAGGSGFLGRALTERLLEAGHHVLLLSRGADSYSDIPNLRVVRWTPNGEAGPWCGELDGADAVVNLAGAGIADARWTAERKKLLFGSRTQSTRSLATAMRIVKTRPPVFVQASGVGFYGAYDNGQEFDERGSPGSDFLSGLCVAWEAEAHPIAELGTRVVFVRSGIVLSHKGGALKKMLPPFRMFVGGRVGSGKQTMSWIHLDDWVGLVMWAINNPAVSGPLNMTAPNPVSNAEFTKALGHALHRPTLVPAPAAALKLVLGSEMVTVCLLKGQRVLPRQAMSLGYTFRFEQIQPAMTAAVRKDSA